MQKLFWTCIFICSISLTPQVQAKDGAYFLRACEAAVKQADGAQMTLEDSLSALNCMTYISGFREALALNSKISKTPKLYCPPEGGVTHEQVARVFTKFLQSNPESLSQSGSLSLYIALSKNYPCVDS